MCFNPTCVHLLSIHIKPLAVKMLQYTFKDISVGKEIISTILLNVAVSFKSFLLGAISNTKFSATDFATTVTLRFIFFYLRIV